MILKIFFIQTTASFCKKMNITINGSEKNANFFCGKLAKIAENCDHNIYPWTGLKIQQMWMFVLRREVFSHAVPGSQDGKFSGIDFGLSIEQTKIGMA
jgi:hypothetical protein